MPNNAPVRINDIATATGLLTRLPIRGADHTRGARAAWAYPIAGLIVGAIGALTAMIAITLGLSPTLTAGLTLTATIATTGALHEDGLADSVDGLWGGNDPTRRLEIMKDSHIGTYGVLALILSIGLRWGALTALFTTGHIIAPILAAAILSRAPMTALMHAMPHARHDGLSHSVGRPSLRSAELSAGLALILGVICLGLNAVLVAISVVIITLATAAIAKAKINGQTGDILGATQQLGEIGALITLATLLT